MKLIHLPEHRIVTAYEEPRCAHFTFANEDGMECFLRDNKDNIRTTQIQRRDWSVDFQPMLTITAA